MVDCAKKSDFLGLESVYAYVSPTRMHARVVAWPYLKSIIEDAVVNEARMEIRWLSGACIVVSSADNPDSLRGREIELVILDDQGSKNDH